MEQSRALAEVYFLDVGQGASQVLLFHDSSLVIIDCGKSASVALALLSNLSFSKIKAIVVSHWHADHVGGLIGILNQYPNQIGAVHFPQTRPAEELVDLAIFQELQDFREKHPETKFDYLNSAGRDPSIHRVGDDHELAELSCIFPSLFDAIGLQLSRDENAGSGVLLLECGFNKVLFPGDVGSIGLEAIHRDKAKSEILNCTISAAPHHTGTLGRSRSAFDGFQNAYEWMYASILRPELVVVSVGTKNNHDHPNEKHLQAARSRGVRVICTQITSRCLSDPVSVAPALVSSCPSHSACVMGSGIGCAGTIQVNLYRDRYTVERWDEHQRAVDQLEAIGTPLCRKPLPAKAVPPAAQQQN